MKDESIPHPAPEVLIPDEILVRAFARLDPLALGLAIGLVTGASVCAATIILLLKGGAPLGPNLGLLDQYIPEYSVSWRGSLVGGAAGFMVGFGFGWTIAVLRNLTLSVYMFASAFWVRVNRFLDDV
jgi:hypothetical protein